MTVTVYRSTDSSAPSLTGQAGSLTSLLDACLVNGYGSQSAAGWTISYTTTNKRVYRNSSSDGTGMYLYIDDTAPTVANEARATGFQSASGLGTGTGQFPTSSQLNIGIGAVVWRKSATANSTARNWVLVADDTVFYLFVETGDITSPLGVMTMMFGDFFSYSSTDTSHCMIIGRNYENQSGANYEWFPTRIGVNLSSPSLTYTLAGHFIAANAANVGGSILCGKHIDEVKVGGGGAVASFTGQSAISGSGGSNNPIGNNYANPAYSMSFPNPVDNGIHFSPIWVHHNNSVRGYLKGLWAPMQNLPLNHQDTFSGTGGMSSKSFLVQSLAGYYGAGGNTTPGQVFVETSNTWS